MVDLRLVGPAIGVWVGALLTFTFDSHWPFVFSLPLVLCCMFGLVRMLAVALTACAMAVGVLAAGLTVVASHPSQLAAAIAARHTVTITGRVATDPVVQRSGTGAKWSTSSLTEFIVNVDSVTDGDHSVEISVPMKARCECVVAVGSIISATGRISPDLAYGERVAAIRIDGPIDVLAEPNLINRSANALRAGLISAVSNVGEDEAALIAGLAVGDETLQNQALNDDMRLSGLSHLTAVSGGNVSIIVIVTLLLVSVFGCGRRTRHVLVFLAICAFVVLVRPQPSVLRAAVMGSVAVLALFSGRPSRGISTLSVAIIVLIVVSPGLATSYGFALSTIATAGLLVLAPMIVTWCRANRWLGRLPQPLLVALAATVAAQVATAPVIALMDAPIGTASVLANLLAAPVVAPVTIGGLLVAGLAVLAMPIAQGLAHVVAIPAGWIAVVAHRGASWPAVPLPTGVIGAMAWIIVCIGVVMLPRRWLLALLALVLVVVCLAPLRRAGWPPPNWVMVACDVGQGDAFVVRVDEFSAVVVDAGPTAGAVAGCLDRLGVAHVPLLVLTHFHADHVDGIEGVAQGRDIGQLVVSPIGNPEAQTASVMDWAHDLGIAVHQAAPGESFMVGSTNWRVLWPRVELVDENPNNASVVLLAEANGVRALLAGDVEPEAQSAIVTAEAPIHVDVMKVPHHGSRYQYPGLIAWSGARIALVSAGVENTYGHPAAETITAWESSGALVARTDTSGDLVVVNDADSGLGVVVAG